MNRKVVVSNRSVYHTYTEVEVEVPNSIKTEDIGQWLNDHSDKYDEAIEGKTDSIYESGIGMRYGMTDTEAESETRYDVLVHDKKLSKFTEIYGGHL